MNSTFTWANLEVRNSNGLPFKYFALHCFAPSCTERGYSAQALNFWLYFVALPYFWFFCTFGMPSSQIVVPVSGLWNPWRPDILWCIWLENNVGFHAHFDSEVVEIQEIYGCRQAICQVDTVCIDLRYCVLCFLGKIVSISWSIRIDCVRCWKRGQILWAICKKSMGLWKCALPFPAVSGFLYSEFRNFPQKWSNVAIILRGEREDASYPTWWRKRCINQAIQVD